LYLIVFIENNTVIFGCVGTVQGKLWKQNVIAPLRESGKTIPELILLASPYRFVLGPLVVYILKIERDHLIVRSLFSSPNSSSSTGGRLRFTTSGPNY
jgi:hypothetical protein